MKAIVNTTVCSLLSAPTRASTLEDEVLYGMVVDILEEAAPGWYRVRTHYGYEGLAAAEDLLFGDDAVETWQSLPKKMVRYKNTCDVLSLPKVQGFFLQSVPKGGLVAPLGEPENNWQKVRLADGREGYVPAAILADVPTAPLFQEEDALRQALVDAAMSYTGTHYRWGGKSPLGIDCSGLTSMAYMLCGILIYRDADIVEGFPIHEISLDQVKPGDLLFFPGHVAMYIGNDRFCHSTARSDACGFTVNSLNPADPDYNAWLHDNITQVGSYF